MDSLKTRFYNLVLVAGASLGSLLPSASLAAPAPYPLSVSSQDQRAPSLSTFQAEPRTFRVTFLDGTNVSDVSAATVFMGWATNAYASTYVTSVWSKVAGGSNGVVDFTFSAADLNTNGSLIYFVGAGSTYRQGALTIAPNPWSTGVSAPTLTSNVNMDLYTWSGGPFIRSVDASNSFALAADVAATNAGLQAQIDGFVSGQGVTTNIKVGAGSSALLTVSNGSSAEVTLNFDASGLATDADLAAGQADASNQFVNVSGDTMTGTLNLGSVLVFSNQQGTATLETTRHGSPVEPALLANRALVIPGLYIGPSTNGISGFVTSVLIHRDVSVYSSLWVRAVSSATNSVRISPTNGLEFINEQSNIVLGRLGTDGFRFGTNSFRIDTSGNIAQDTNNTATLGVVSATSISGDGSGLTNLTSAGVTVAFTPTNATFSAQNVEAALVGIDSALAGAGGSSIFGSTTNASYYHDVLVTGMTSNNVRPEAIGSAVINGSSNEIRNSSYSVIAGGSGNSISSAGEGNAVFASDVAAITTGDNAFIAASGGGSSIGASDAAIIAGSGAGSVLGRGSAIIGGRNANTIAAQSSVIAGGGGTVTLGASGFDLFAASSIRSGISGASYRSTLLSSDYSYLTHGSTLGATIINGDHTTNSAGSTLSVGSYLVNAHQGTIMFGDRTGATTYFSSQKTNSLLFRFQNGVGINTNNPAQALDVNGNVKVNGNLYLGSLGDYLYADGTNLFYVNSTNGTTQITSN